MNTQSLKRQQYKLSYFQWQNGHWNRESEIITLEPFTGYLTPDDSRLSIYLPKGVALDSVTLTLLGKEEK